MIISPLRYNYGRSTVVILIGFAVLKSAQLCDAATKRIRVPQIEAFHSPLYRQRYHSALSNAQSSSLEPALGLKSVNLDGVERVFAISDLHTDNIGNMNWLMERCTVDLRRSQTSDTVSESPSQNSCIPGPNDVLIIAGDISHSMSILRESLSIIQDNLRCHIFFVWGNHEAWVGGEENDSLRLKTSLEKIDAVKNLCYELGVHVEHRLVGATNTYPVWIAPMEGWYDGSLTLDGCEDLCTDFAVWPWVDFVRCAWPDSKILDIYKRSKSLESVTSLSSSGQRVDRIQLDRIPLGLVELVSQRNRLAIEEIHDEYSNWVERYESADEKNLPGLITFSHFLTNQMSLPDWKDPSSHLFLREEWLDHTVPKLSAKFAKVAGSSFLDEQIRSIVPHYNVLSRGSSPSALALSDLVQHLHVFGHSHRPKDFVTNGVRYIHNPLGKPKERERDFLSRDVGFQLIWDCTRCSLPSSVSSPLQDDGAMMSHPASVSSPCYRPGGEVPGKQIIRFWEEKKDGVYASKVIQKKREMLEMNGAENEHN